MHAARLGLARAVHGHRSAVGTGITAVGARGHFGLNALQVALAERAVQLEPRPTPFRDGAGGEVGLALAACLPPDVVGFERFVELAAPPLREAAAREPEAPMPLVLALPDADRPDQLADRRYERNLVATIARQSGAAVDIARSVIVRAGHAGFALALARGRDLLAQAPPSATCTCSTSRPSR